MLMRVYVDIAEVGRGFECGVAIDGQLAPGRGAASTLLRQPACAHNPNTRPRTGPEDFHSHRHIPVSSLDAHDQLTQIATTSLMHR